MVEGEGRMSKTVPDSTVLHGSALALKTNPCCVVCPTSRLGSACPSPCPQTQPAYARCPGLQSPVYQRRVQTHGWKRSETVSVSSRPSQAWSGQIGFRTCPSHRVPTPMVSGPWLVRKGPGSAALALPRHDQVALDRWHLSAPCPGQPCSSQDCHHAGLGPGHLSSPDVSVPITKTQACSEE